jgi:hypothetical protein
MNANTLDAIRRMIDAGADNDVILAVLASLTVTDQSTPAPASRRSMTARRDVVTVGHVNGSQPVYVKPDQTRTVYRLTALGRKLMPGAKNPGGNNGAVIAYFASIDNAWSDTRAMRSAGVLSHGEHDGKNKALESAIHGMKVRGWLTMRDKPEATAPAPRQRGTEI